MKTITAVIAAGGYGTRCDSDVPKSLLRIGGITYLEVLLIELSKAGINDAVIYCNRPEHINQIVILTRGIMSTHVLLDKGVTSTFELAKHSTRVVSSSSILFCYGHSPRPAEHLRLLLMQRKLPAVSVVDSTTKKCVIKHLYGGYLEPPYLLSVSSLQQSCSTEWMSYFAEDVEPVGGISINGPCEFNHIEERCSYNKYLRSWSLCKQNLTTNSKRTSNLPLRFGFAAVEL